MCNTLNLGIFGQSPLPVSQGELSRTTRRQDSCVSLRLCLHDTQLPYSISYHTASFRQRCKERTPAKASEAFRFSFSCSAPHKYYNASS